MSSKSESSVNSDSNVANTSIPQSILDDLCSRFLINLPEKEQNDMVRVFFQIEQAHWHYVDFLRKEQPSLPSHNLKEFTKIILEKFPFLNKKNESINKLMTDWRKYKFSVPVYGAILLNKKLDKCVLVQAYTGKNSWGFPRGKLNKDETAFDCAKREVLEETGFDITDFANPEAYIDTSDNEQVMRLYLVDNVPEDTKFETRTRGEIKDIRWFNVKDLPSHKKDSKSKENTGLNPNSFFMVIPFVKSLRKWIGSQQRLRNQEAAHHDSVQAHPQHQLQRLVKSEEARLTIENKRVESDMRREEAQQRFLAQMDDYHPLRPQAYGSSKRDKGNKYPSENDQRYFKILQRSDMADDTTKSGRRSGSPRNARGTPPRMSIQESNTSESRNFSPSSNSAFTRVPNASPKPKQSNANRTKTASPVDPNNTSQHNDAILSSSFNFLAPAWVGFKINKDEFLRAIRA